MIGIPIPERTLITIEGVLTQVSTCGECGTEVFGTERKDFESFTGIEYQRHWTAYHSREQA